MSSNGILQAFKAESLLADSDLLVRIDNLRKNLQYSSAGEQVSFNDYLVTLREAVDAIPKLELESDVAPGTENQYSIQLIHSMDKILGDCDKTLRKLSHFQGRLRDAERQINNLKAEFVAWYLLAATTLISSLEDTLPVKLPAKEIRNLADAEFSRLIHNLDLKVLSVLEDLKLEAERVTQHKATQKEKHNLGRDQANASWTSTLPALGNAVIENERPDKLAQEPEIEEDEPGVPAFISRKPSIAAVTDYCICTEFPPNNPACPVHFNPEIKGTFKKQITSLTPVTAVANEAEAPAKPHRRLIDEEDEEL